MHIGLLNAEKTFCGLSYEAFKLDKVYMRRINKWVVGKPDIITDGIDGFNSYVVKTREVPEILPEPLSHLPHPGYVWNLHLLRG